MYMWKASNTNESTRQNNTASMYDVIMDRPFIFLCVRRCDPLICPKSPMLLTR